MRPSFIRAALLVLAFSPPAVARAPGPCAGTPTGALALRPYAPPCALPGTASDELAWTMRGPAPDTPGLPYDGAITIDSEAEFARIYGCSEPSKISWTRDRLLVYRGPGDTASIVAPRWLAVDGAQTVLALRWTERCQGVPPGSTVVTLALLVPRSAPRAVVTKVCHPLTPPCLAP
jgi:hypothetical protein